MCNDPKLITLALNSPNKETLFFLSNKTKIYFQPTAGFSICSNEFYSSGTKISFVLDSDLDTSWESLVKAFYQPTAKRIEFDSNTKTWKYTTRRAFYRQTMRGNVGFVEEIRRDMWTFCWNAEPAGYWNRPFFPSSGLITNHSRDRKSEFVGVTYYRHSKFGKSAVHRLLLFPV